MADFKVIESQEELDKVIGDRIGRAKDQARENEEKLKNEIADLKKGIADRDSQITELTEKQNGHADDVARLTSEIAGHKLREIKHQIAHEFGLPYELADRLSGDNEESLKADAETLKGLITTNKPETRPPAFKAEKDPGDERQEDLKQVLEKLQRR